MDPSATSGLFAVLGLVLVSGAASAARTSVVAARKSNLSEDASAGSRRAAAALALIDRRTELVAASRLLASVATVWLSYLAWSDLVPWAASRVRAYFSHGAVDLAAGLPSLGEWARPTVTFATVATACGVLVVLGELVPRRIGAAYPESTAKFLAPFSTVLLRVSAPLVRAGERAAAGIARAVGLGAAPVKDMSAEELRSLVERGAESGLFSETEERIFLQVMKLGSRRASALVTPRADVRWLDVAKPLSESWEAVKACDHSYFPVGRGSIDELVGVVSAKDVASGVVAGLDSLPPEVIRPAFKIPSGTAALGVLERFKEERKHMAVVIDEHGGVDGVVTTHDLMEAIVGHFADDGEERLPLMVTRPDGVTAADASVDIDELTEFLGMKPVSGKRRPGYHSLGGFIMMEAGHIPVVGEVIEHGGFRFEVAGMRGRRIDRVLISRLA